MIFLDISHYDARRNRHGNKVIGPRERNGQPSRSAGTPEHMVYFVQVDGNPRVKVGRTKNIRSRIRAYENNSGCPARCVAQLIVSSADASLTLEREAIALLRARYERSMLEWFAIPADDLFGVIAEIKSQSSVPIVRMSGLPVAEEEAVPISSTLLKDTVVAQHQYKRRRTVRRG